jgi:hypothetical protein
MSRTGSFFVHTYHVNVGVGDCTIVCKCQIDGTSTMLRSVVLIDGGYASGSGAIKYHFEEIIAKQYTLPSTWGGKVKLDAIVITHFDGDHYEGITTLLKNDLEDYAKNLDTDVKNAQCSFFQYDTGKAILGGVNKTPLAANTEVNRIPKTVMYIPYWNNPPRISRSTRLESMEGEQLQVSTTDKINVLSFDVATNNATGENARVVRAICRLSCTWQDNLAKNLFGNMGAPLGDYASPAELANAIRELGNNEPALVCVGCDSISFGRKLPQTGRPILPLIHIGLIARRLMIDESTCIGQLKLMHPPASMKIVDVNTPGNKGTNTNKASIICVVQVESPIT